MSNTGKLRIFASLFLAAWAGTASATEYQSDLSHSEVVFKVRHMGISTVTGRFDNFQATFDVDPANVGATKGSAVIQVASINTNNPKRDGHLRSPDFFNADSFPEIKFSSREVRDVNMADSTCTLIGDLTMRGVTKEIALKVKGSGLMNNDGWGNQRAAFSASGKVNRFDYGLQWNKLIEAGGAIVGPEVELVLSFEGIHKIAPPSEEKKGQPEKTKAKAK